MTITDLQKPVYAEVAVDGPVLNDFLTYSLPPDIALRPGDVVWVPLRRKRVLGVVMQLTDNVPAALVPKLRPLIGRVETEELDLDMRDGQTNLTPPPIVAPHLLELARWISAYYMARPFDSVSLTLPPGLARQAVETLVLLNDPWVGSGNEPADELPAQQASLIDAISINSRPLHDFAYDQTDLARARVLLHVPEGEDEPAAAELDVVRDTFGVGGFTAALDALEKRGLVRRVSFAPVPALRPKYHTFVRLAPALVAASREPSAGSGQTLPALIESQKRATRRARALLTLAQASGIPIGETPDPPVAITADEGGWVEADTLPDTDNTTLKALVAKGYIETQERQSLRDPLATHIDEVAIGTRPIFAPLSPQLTYQQSGVWRSIYDSLQRPGAEAFLLHGVTGSGKTEIYLRTTARVLASGKQAIILVPEIALTEQTIKRFVARFPGRVAVRHSDLTVGESFDQWRRIRAGKADIVIGARSALFSPLPRLGLIIIDEEHEPSYKQDTPPHYHAREAAFKLAELTGAKVILGSATPSLETYFAATASGSQHGALTQAAPESAEHPAPIIPQLPLHLLTLTERIAPPPQTDPNDAMHAFAEAVPVPLPQVQVVDLRQELKSGNTGIFSRALIVALRETLAAGKQAILFLNRRGNATCVMCRNCGAVMVCKRCGAPLIYHSRVAGEGDLSCHRCGKHYPNPENCPKCGSTRIRYFGIGTQKVEAEVERLFPDARLLRWDADTIKAAGRGGYADLFHRFADHEADVLVGTQMIAKGLDMPGVTLVGVVMADTGLYLPDPRAAERTFALLTQVAGRAGRRGEGKVIVQSYAPDNYAIVAASHHDYEGFYKQELAFRRGAHYPPFSQLIRMVYTYTNQRAARIATLEQAELLRVELIARGLMLPPEGDEIYRPNLPAQVDLIGPAPTFFERVRGSYRWHLIVRLRVAANASLDEQIEAARQLRAAIRALRLGPEWVIDVDPVAML